MVSNRLYRSGPQCAVTPPQQYSFVPHNKDWCEILQANLETNKDGEYAYFCEQHKEQPRRTGKLDRELQSRLNWPCPEPAMACKCL